MADLSNILIEGETILWQGQPDFSRARRGRGALRTRLLIELGLLVAVLFAVSVLLQVERGAGIEGLVRLLIWTGLSGLALLAFALAVKLMSSGYERGQTAFDTYFVTNRRVATCRSDTGERISILKGKGDGAWLKPNGSVHDLHISALADDGCSTIVMRAIADGPEIEKLVLKILFDDEGKTS